MKNEKFRGLGVALVTPFKSDLSIDEAALERLIDTKHRVGLRLRADAARVDRERRVRTRARDQALTLDRPAAIARPVFRRVPTEELDDTVVGLVGGWIAARAKEETFRSFCDRSTDDELALLAGREAHQRGH